MLKLYANINCHLQYNNDKERTVDVQVMLEKELPVNNAKSKAEASCDVYACILVVYLTTWGANHIVRGERRRRERNFLNTLWAGMSSLCSTLTTNILLCKYFKKTLKMHNIAVISPEKTSKMHNRYFIPLYT